jgi:hypothetical protein
MRFLPAILSHLLLMAAAFGLGTPFSHFSPVIFSKVDRVTATALSGLGLPGAVLFLVGMIRFSMTTVLVILTSAALSFDSLLRWATT